MKKFGYFLLGFVPLALCFVLQIGAGFIFAILSKLFMNIPGIGPEELTYSQWEDMLLYARENFKSIGKNYDDFFRANISGKNFEVDVNEKVKEQRVL